MKFFNHKNRRRVFIEPGEYYVSVNGEIISTLLGSCVAACLYDPIQRIMGMNHFLLAYRAAPSQSPIFETEAGRYGLYAMELLINSMMAKGAKRCNLKAKCFGGSNVFQFGDDIKSQFSIGDRNVQFIKEFLNKENIPIINSCLGGSVARSIFFMPDDFSVYVKKTSHEQLTTIKQIEKTHWQKSLESKDKTVSHVDYW
jgi:chemotaxis protein CheD